MDSPAHAAFHFAGAFINEFHNLFCHCLYLIGSFLSRSISDVVLGMNPQVIRTLNHGIVKETSKNPGEGKWNSPHLVLSSEGKKRVLTERLLQFDLPGLCFGFWLFLGYPELKNAILHVPLGLRSIDFFGECNRALE